MSAFTHIQVPKEGQAITYVRGHLQVPQNPIIPYIEGDGIGVDITPVMRKVVDGAVEKAYEGQRQIHWMEIYAGEKATRIYGADQYLPEETLKAIQQFLVAIKGPLSTPVGSGIRSINVALRQILDLYVCLRPVRYFKGTPSPLKHPELTNMVIFRENSEDIYAGIEWPAASPEADKVIRFLEQEMGVKKIRFDKDCGIGIKPVSKAGTQRLVRSAIEYAIEHHLPSVTLVHKGNIMKFTEGAFKQWGYDLAEREFGAVKQADGTYQFPHPKTDKPCVIKDVIADAFLQQILLRPSDYSVIATLNLNGDYISDALAAQVGGIGLAPGANLSDAIAMFEATHGTAPKYAGQNKVNPSSILLSAAMMLKQLSWAEAGDLIERGIEHAISQKTVTYDLERLMSGATLLNCSQFGEAVIRGMGDVQSSRMRISAA